LYAKIIILLWLSGALRPGISGRVDRVGKVLGTTNRDATDKRKKGQWLSILWSAESAAVVHPACAGWAAPAPLLGGDITNTLTAARCAVESSPFVVANAAISAEANVLDFVGINTWNSVPEANCPAAVLSIPWPTVIVRLEDEISSSAAAVGWQAAKGSWVVLLDCVFQDVEIVSTAVARSTGSKGCLFKNFNSSWVNGLNAWISSVGCHFKI